MAARKQPKRRATPAALAKREEDKVRRLRAQLDAAQIRAALSYYAAADKGRRNRDWKGSTVSADQAIIPDAETLIGRARITVANTWIGKAAVRAHVRNVVGRGIMVVPVAKDAAGDELADANRRAGDLFMRWASDKTACDLERRRTFWQTQRVSASEEFVTGDIFIVWSYVPNPRTVGLRLQLFEAEQLDRTVQSWEGNEVRGGVEVDEYGGAVAYHFYSRNPNDYLVRNNWRSVRIPAERVLHYFDAERVLQSRGVSRMAAVLQDVRDFSAFKDATLMRARMEACIGMVIKKNLPTPSGSALTMPYAANDSGTTSGGLRTTDFVPGMVPELRPGEDVVPFTPQSPGNQYDPFTTITLRGIGAGMGMSFGALTRHNDANYSAARQDMLEDEREIGPQQDALIDHVIMPIYELWYRFAVLEGRLPDVDAGEFLSDPDRFVEAEYIAPARPWIDPEKEANAYEKALKLRIITRKEIVATRGGRFQNLLRQIAQERDEAKAVDLAFPEDVEQASSLTKADKGGPVTDPTAADEGTTQPDAGNTDQGTDNGDNGDNTAAAAASAKAKPRTVPLAQADAPNYRPSGDPVTACATCSHAAGMYCKAYDFNFTPGYTCDSWEAEPPTENEGGKILPPGPNPGDAPIDAPQSPFNDRAARGLAAGSFSKAVVMVPVYGQPGSQALAFGASIPDSDLAGDGRETFPHVTALYGLKDDALAGVKRAAAGIQSISMDFGKTIVFPATADRNSDVVVLPVKSAEMVEFNRQLRKLPHENDYPDYTPHLTIAYVKAGSGQKYAGKSVIDSRATANDAIFSDSSGTQTTVRLNA